MEEPVQTPLEPPIDETGTVPPGERQAKRGLIIGLGLIAVLILALVVLLVVLAIDARRTDSASVISILRDAALILVAFETLVIGTLMIILVFQVQALVSLLRDEIRPMLEMLSETLTTVRGTTEFMSQKVVSPTIRMAGLVAGLRRVTREIVTLAKGSDEQERTN